MSLLPEKALEVYISHKEAKVKPVMEDSKIVSKGITLIILSLASINPLLRYLKTEECPRDSSHLRNQVNRMSLN